MSRLKFILLSLAAVCAVSAVASASASALEFYKASNKELIKSPLNIVSLGGTTILKGEISAKEVEISCLHVHNSGTIENVNGMGLGLVLVLFLHCEVLKPVSSGCIIPHGELHIPSVHLLAVTISGVTYLEFIPENGNPAGTFLTIPLENCTITALNGSYPVKGLAYANVINSAIQFKTGAPNNKLKFAGSSAEFTSGEIAIEMEGGGGIEVR